MSYTKDIACSNSWAVLITGQTSGFLQLKEQGPVLVQVAQSEPSSESREGVVLFGGELEELGFAALEAGDVVYGRTTDPGETSTVAVVAPGSAPV